MTITVRGGLGKAPLEKSSRLITKFAESAELADNDDLIVDDSSIEENKKVEYRQRFTVNENAQFVMNSREEKIKELLRDLLAEDDVKENAELEELQAKKAPKQGSKEALDNAESNEVAIEIPIEEKAEKNPVRDLKPHIRKNSIAWAVRQIKRCDMGSDKTTNSSSLKKANWEKLRDLLKNKNGQLNFNDKDNNDPLDKKLENFCFAGPRKAGTWYSALDEIKTVKASRRMVFGLEICTDNARMVQNLMNRDGNNLKNDSGENLGIDIHLVPSGGMTVSPHTARDNGLVFNCEGGGSGMNGKRMTIETAGKTLNPQSMVGKPTPPSEYSKGFAEEVIIKPTEAIKLDETSDFSSLSCSSHDLI